MGFKRSPFPMIQGTKGHSSALTKQMKDLPLGSEERVSEYEKRKWKHDETTTGHDKYKERQAAAAKAETERTSVKTEGLGKKKGETLTVGQKESQTEKLKGAKLRKLEAKKQTADIKSGKDDPKTGTKVSRWFAGKKSKRLERKIERVATGKTRKEQRQERRAKRKADKESPLTQKVVKRAAEKRDPGQMGEKGAKRKKGPKGLGDMSERARGKKGPKGIGDMSERARKPENLIEKRKRQMKETQIFSKENVAKRSKAAKDKEIEKNLPWQKTITRKSMPKFSKKK